MTTHHTPGQWYIGDEGESRGNTRRILGAGHLVCTVESYPCATTGLADALLISAAPDLIAALQMALVQITQDNNERMARFRGTEQQARAALSKATGGKP